MYYRGTQQTLYCSFLYPLHSRRQRRSSLVRHYQRFDLQRHSGVARRYFSLIYSAADISDDLTELKKNCSPELIIYIVGSKADLYRHRQVTSDFARLSLHNWFPPPRPPPPPPPPPQSSTLSYIRPRFTSFPGLRSSPPTTPTPPETPAYLDLPSSRSAALIRSKTSTPTTRPRANTLIRSNTTATATRPQQSRFGSHFGFAAGGWNDTVESSSNSIEEDDEEDDPDNEEEWGLSKGMELFEVSAKDDLGGLISALRDFG